LKENSITLAGHPTPLPCIYHLHHGHFAANSARNRNLGSKTAQECGRDIVGTCIHHPFCLRVPCQTLGASLFLGGILNVSAGSTK